MTRREFMESVGATCQNWQWSWSFVNPAKRFVVFGAWDRNTAGQRSLILSETWEINSRGRRNPGFQQSRDHVRLVEEEGYTLKTFPMEYSDARKDKHGVGPATIKGFTPELSDRTLKRIGNGWYACDEVDDIQIAEEIPTPEKYSEGAKKTIAINAFERSARARRACIRHHGLNCTACGFNFEAAYGTLGEVFIHVHHIIPIGAVGDEYSVDPVKDLVPICPNCHAMIHRVNPPLTIEQLRNILNK
ncbi:MAG: HNH endonuclease [Desulfatiglans sp.]|jgi:5-methylcytosine-specific restriction protein A|nr:HNH endonuclease [Desulfatiglans sp.]